MASKYRRDIKQVSNNMDTQVPYIIRTAMMKEATKDNILMEILKRKI